MGLFEVLKEYFPKIEERLKAADNGAALAQIEEQIGEALPAALKEMYAKYDGEKDNPHTGMVLGFSLMETADILDTMKYFKKYNLSEINETTALIPFAWDGDSCYFCVDMSPEKGGKKGQVAVVESDYDRYTKIADSLEDFFEFVHQILKNGKCHVSSEGMKEPYFQMETGHFMNVAEDILQEYYRGNESEEVEVDLPKDFWQEHFGKEKVSDSILQKKKSLMISKGNMTLSLAPLAYMSKLQDLVIHNCVITDFEMISAAIELKKLVLVNCTFEYEKLVELSKLPKLKMLTLRKMPLTDISCLLEVKSLKTLRLLDMEEFDVTQLKVFTKLQELELKNLRMDSTEFLNHCKSLKLLVLEGLPVQNLNFLQYLKKLKNFELTVKVADEDGLKYLKDLTKLEEFMYPVSDMAIYAGCESLERIGIDAKEFQNPEVLENLNITGVTICSAHSRQEAEDTIEIVKKYVKLYSYGMRGDYMH